MTTEAIQSHRDWAASQVWIDDEQSRCAGCGCAGNLRCSKAKPLGAPEHNCELDVGDADESGRCYCCRMADVPVGPSFQ